VILTVVETVAPSAVVAVTVMVDGPVGVGVVPAAFVQPTRAPAARTSRASVRYAGARRNGSVRCRTALSIPSIDRRAAATNQSRGAGHPPLPPFGAGIELPVFAGFAMALIVMIELADKVLAGIDDVPAEQVAPVNDCGSEQVTVSADGNGVFDGVVGKSIFTIAGVPAVTVIVPGVEAS
jgi:hypothetical protein